MSVMLKCIKVGKIMSEKVKKTSAVFIALHCIAQKCIKASVEHTLQRLSELSTIKIHKDRGKVFIGFLVKGGQRRVDYLTAIPLVIGATG